MENKGKIKKGQVLNPSGHPKGSKNKATQEIREYFKMFVENNMGQFEKDFKELTPQERIKTLIELSKMILPKQLEAEVNEVPEPQTITFVMIDSEGNSVEEKVN